jgi:O-antigen/teichoic acid export membrane protein
LNNENTENWKKLGFLMSKFLLSMIIPVTLVFFIFAKDVLDIVYGVNKYAGAVNILRIFAIILLVRFCMEPFGLMLTTENRQKFRMYTVIVITLLNFVLNIFFIPLYGPYGAAIVSLISNSAMLIIYWSANKKLFYEWIMNFKTLLIFMLFGFLMYVFNYIKSISIFWGIAIIFIVCFVFVLMFYFTKEEKRLILSGQLNFPFISKKVN